MFMRLNGKGIKIKKRYIVIFILFIVGGYFAPLVGMYSYSESAALKYSFPDYEGERVYEKEFGNHKVVIMENDTEFVTHGYAKLLKNKLDTFYKVSVMATLEHSDYPMNISWSASRATDQTFDTILVAQINNPEIKKVVISNDQGNERENTLKEAKEQSTFYKEFKVEDGYVVYYSNLPYDLVGGYVFRGLNAEDEIIAVDQ